MRQLDLVYSFDPPNIVYLTLAQDQPISNHLVLNITHPGNEPLVTFENERRLTPDDPLPAIGSDPGFRFDRLNIYFVWADGSGDSSNALCTAEEAKNIRVSAGSQSSSWYASKPQYRDDIGTFWTLFPKDKAVLDAQEHISFDIKAIVSTVDKGAPLLYVEPGVEGYATKTVTPAPTYTMYPAVIESFDIQANPVRSGERLSFTLSWKIENAASFQITADDGPGGQERTLPVPATATSYQVQPRQLETHYTLTASATSASAKENT